MVFEEESFREASFEVFYFGRGIWRENLLDNCGRGSMKGKIILFLEREFWKEGSEEEFWFDGLLGVMILGRLRKKMVKLLSGVQKNLVWILKRSR